ncbi:MAG: hypothetical protein ABI336_03765 [Humibacillus sp.]
MGGMPSSGSPWWPASSTPPSAAVGGVLSAVVALLDPALVVLGGAWGIDIRVVAELG